MNPKKIEREEEKKKGRERGREEKKKALQKRGCKDDTGKKKKRMQNSVKWEKGKFKTAKDRIKGESIFNKASNILIF